MNLTNTVIEPDRIDTLWSHTGVTTVKYYFVCPDKTRKRDCVINVFHADIKTPEKQAVIEAWNDFERRFPSYYAKMVSGRLPITLQHELARNRV